MHHGDGRVGLYDNNDIIFETSAWTAVTVAKLGWRYGLDFYNIRNWINDNLFKKFNRWVLVVKFKTMILCVQFGITVIFI